jgi:Flp pilus assembly protein protease CpaA
MHNKYSNKVISLMLLLQFFVTLIIFSNLPTIKISLTTYSSYIFAVGLILFAISFFVFSFKSCLKK